MTMRHTFGNSLLTLSQRLRMTGRTILYPISEVPDILPELSGGRKVHPATVWRWINKGVHGRFLGSRLVGGRRFVTQQDIEAFLGPESTPEVRSAAARSNLATRYGI